MDNKKSASKTILTGAISGAVSAIIVATLMFNFGGPPLKQNQNGNFWQNLFSSIEKENSSMRYGSDEVVTEEDYIIDAVKNAQDSVVSVIITKDVPIVEQYYVDPFGGSPFGNNGFGSPFNFQIPQYKQNGTEKREVGGGSGFIVSSDGLIVTNKHVVADPDAEYTVFLRDETKYEATVLATDALNDIAILKIEAEDLPALQFGDSDNLLPGQTVIAIGNPLLEFSNSVSVGVVSGLARSITAGDGAGYSEQLEGIIQTDAAINPGNSGGPLLNLNGEVIGVNVAVASAENIGFSVPASVVKKAVTSVQKTGKIVRTFLGVRYVPITESLKEANNLTVDYGVLVARGETVEQLAVIPGSPADKAGLAENDIILEVDGIKLEEDVSLARIVAEKEVGEVITLKVLSKGEEEEIKVTLEELKEES